MQLDKLKELEDLHTRLGGLDFGCGCCGGDTTSDSMDWAERVFDLFPELVAAAKREARLLAVRATFDTPHDVCDGTVQMTIGDAIKQYGEQCLDWIFADATPAQKHQKILGTLGNIAKLFEQVVDGAETKARVVLLEDALQKMTKALNSVLSAMEMQEKRETGEFHIPAKTAEVIWETAKTEASIALKPQEPRP